MRIGGLKSALSSLMVFGMMAKGILTNSGSSGQGESSQGSDSSHISPSASVVFTVLVSLLLAAGCREVKKITKAPFTPLLLIVGVVIGSCFQYLGEFGRGMTLILELNPHGILLIFIPILIFEAAFNTDVYVFKKQLLQVMLLAGPGVLIGAVLLAFGFNYILGYSKEFDIFGGLTFGSICSATDTVAVLALLKEMGTPKNFNLLFEGENLINDATAMVLMMVFSALFKGGSGMTFWQAILQFLRLSVGGALLGFSIFLVVIVWLRRIVKDKTLIIVIVFASANLTFYFAEFVFGVSGLLSVVCF